MISKKSLAVLIGLYKFDQKSGMSIKNSVSQELEPAKFGLYEKAPHWNSEVLKKKNYFYFFKKEAGVEFTNSDQHIKIPSFIPKAGTSITPISFTVNFWIKLKEGSDNSGFIFRYSRSNVKE